MNNLYSFLVVAEELSFTKAAERLYLTQPALSRRIAKLEQELDVSLFARWGRGVSLTARGAILVPLARDLVDRTGELEVALAATPENDSPEFDALLVYSIQMRVTETTSPPVRFWMS